MRSIDRFRKSEMYLWAHVWTKMSLCTRSCDECAQLFRAVQRRDTELESILSEIWSHARSGISARSYASSAPIGSILCLLFSETFSRKFFLRFRRARTWKMKVVDRNFLELLPRIAPRRKFRLFEWTIFRHSRRLLSFLVRFWFHFFQEERQRSLHSNFFLIKFRRKKKVARMIWDFVWFSSSKIWERLSRVSSNDFYFRS